MQFHEQRTRTERHSYQYKSRADQSQTSFGHASTALPRRMAHAASLIRKIARPLTRAVVECLDLAKTTHVAFLVSEVRPDESVSQFERHCGTDDTSAENENVHIVVFHALMSRVDVVADRSANSVYLIGGDRSAHARTADQYASLAASIEDCLSDLDGKIWVVDGVGSAGTNIDYLVTCSREVFHEKVFQFQSGVVGPKSYLHDALELSLRAKASHGTTRPESR